MKTKLKLLFFSFLFYHLSFAQVPIKVSALPSVTGKCIGCQFPVLQGATKKYSVDSLTALLEAYADSIAALKQNTLVSGTNIKTVNGVSPLGSGDIPTFWTPHASNSIANNNSGNVGIGTTTPGYKLEVNGEGYFNSFLAVHGNLSVDQDLRMSGSTNGIRLNGDYGVDGQILTSHGSGSAPTWQDSPGGGSSGPDSTAYSSAQSITDTSLKLKNLKGGFTLFRFKNAIAGGTGSGYKVYNVFSYGAISDTVTNNTIAIQAAINDCHTKGGGVVYLPAGHYRTNKLLSYIDVSIRGDGYISTFLETIGSDTMIVIHNVIAIVNTDHTNTVLQDIFMDGRSTSVAGFGGESIANFFFRRVKFKKFTGAAMVLHNSLIGVIESCYFTGSTNGIIGYASEVANGATTLVTIRDCSVNNSSKWGVDWQGGGMLKIEHGDFGSNGSGYDTTSGAIYYHNNSWPGGLHVADTWFEENLGTVINISDNVTTTSGTNYPVTTVHSITDCQDLGQQYGFTVRSIFLSGNNQRLGVINTSLSGATKNIVAQGTNTTVTTLNTVTDNSNIIRNSATITNY